jgi:hypothetical protein
MIEIYKLSHLVEKNRRGTKINSNCFHEKITNQPNNQP